MSIDRTVIILGAGMSGICMAIKLREAGIDDLLILEKATAPGGTWHDNTYPGACCDVASHLYCYSFEPNPDWSRAYSPQPEIQAYFEHCVKKYGLAAAIRYDCTVRSADYDEAEGAWEVGTARGEKLRCRFLVSGLGQLNLPNIPGFPGADSFAGTSFHSARWQQDINLAGKRVAVIGNAASAIQFIPVIARQAERVVVYQRSANYIIPRNDFAYSPADRQCFRDHPRMQKLSRLRWYLRQELLMYGAMLPGSLRQRMVARLARSYLERQISDPVLRQQLWPDYPLGCKRVLVSDDYYQAFDSGRVELVSSPITAIAPQGVLTEDGVDRPVEVLVYATGFRATEFLAEIAVRGCGGIALGETWADGAEALRGVAVPGYPNLFLLYGPNTNLGHNSIIHMVEAQVGYIIRCIGKALAHDLKSLGADRRASEAFNARLQEKLARMVWGGECGSWYKNAAGKITNNWPCSSTRFALSMRQPDFSEFEMTA